jgi:polyketide synthase PksN
MTATDLDISELALDDLLALADGEEETIDTASGGSLSKRIAVIGMAGRIGGCENLDAFWQMLRSGGSALTDLDEARKADLMEFLDLKGALPLIEPSHYLRASFLKEIDKFDHQFFGMAKQEADLTDPNQRLFIETAWTALEQAGYGGESIKGSATGVFVGFSSDFGESYRRLLGTLAPDAPEVAVVGNIQSIIASRIAYHLDLRGPSLLVDTACSSGLVAMHVACRALRNGDCDMALVGAVKIDLVPVAEVPEAGVGIKDIRDTAASDGRTRTFDDACEGTSAAEGVIAFILKPLDKAIGDGDSIHAVICGSAVNQDGRSVGITAPNSAAQEQLILNALQDAGIPAETVSYIEAHGTATSLGDPIEVNGIQRAFRRHSQHRQFCAVGSVKTNIGHMDNAAGLAGVAKVILSMQHGELPPSLNFSRPNRKISFEHSPVYVNDILRPWRVGENRLLRAGVNSFGLSGTNCHLILESTPAVKVRAAASTGPYLLPISAGSETALRELVRAYAQWLDAYDGSLENLCHTAAVGRLHHTHRLALVVESLDGLSRLLGEFLSGESLNPAVALAGSFRLVSDRQERRKPGDVTESDRGELSRQAEALCLRYREVDVGRNYALLSEAIDLYVRGADFQWGRWYQGTARRRIPIPTYPFARTRCWVETTKTARQLASRNPIAKPIAHPLVDRCLVKTLGFSVYQSVLGASSHWELADHKIGGVCVLPGTAYVEMILEIAAQMHAAKDSDLCIEHLVFIRPLILDDHERREIHILVEGLGETYKLRIISHSPTGTDEWDVHAESVMRPSAKAPRRVIDINALLARLPLPLAFARQDDVSRGLDIGDRWNLSFLQGWAGEADNEFLVHLALPDDFRGESRNYHYHPALLDTAVNAVNHLLGEDSLYLPLSYRRFECYDALPTECFVLLRKKTSDPHSVESFSFDIDLLDKNGCVRSSIFDYTVKRVADTGLLQLADGVEPFMHEVRWVQTPASPSAAIPADPICFIRRDTPEQAAIVSGLRERGVQVVELVRAAAPTAPDGDPLNHDGLNYEQTLAMLETSHFAGVIYAVPTPLAEEDVPASDTKRDMHDLFDFLKTFVGKMARRVESVLVLVPGAFSVPGHEQVPAPQCAALAAMVRVAALEFPHVRFRCLDTDRPTDGSLLLAELASVLPDSLSVYREGVRYGECLQSLPPAKPAEMSLGNDGVYVMTGGTGSLCLELAAHWADRGPVNLALIGSKPLPPRETWQGLVESGGDDKLIRRLNKLIDLEGSGAKIEYISVDVADFSAMQGVFQHLREDYGQINGVVHAAGRAGEGFLINKSLERFDQVVSPKIDGAWILHQLTLDDPLEFFVMFSSIATVLRNPGQSDYTAANAYLDCLAQLRRSMNLPALSICWPAWREVGMALDHDAVDEDELIAPIATSTALALLDTALSDAVGLPPVLILGAINPRAPLAALEDTGLQLSGPIRRRLGQNARLASASQSSGVNPGGEGVVLKGLDAPDDIDHAVGRLWGKILGVREVDVDDVFSDLGGNSILTTQMYREFEILYPEAMELADLFTRVTIREQADHIRAALGRNKPAPHPVEDDIDRVLAMLAKGEMSAEEAQSILGG